MVHRVVNGKETERGESDGGGSEGERMVVWFLLVVVAFHRSVIHQVADTV
jgi:hypothetical protein